MTYVSYNGESVNPSIEKDLAHLERKGKKDARLVVSPEYSSSHHAGAATARLTQNIPNGPYFASTKTGKIFKAYRLYEDTNLAFLEPAISDEEGEIKRLMATSEVGLLKSLGKLAKTLTQNRVCLVAASPCLQDCTLLQLLRNLWLA